MFKRFRGTPRIVALRGMVVALLGLATIGLGVWLWRPELVPQPHVPPGTSYATVVYSHIIHYLKLQYLRQLCRDGVSGCRMKTTNPNNLGENALQ